MKQTKEFKEYLLKCKQWIEIDEMYYEHPELNL